jgi:hypothetical protein
VDVVFSNDDDGAESARVPEKIAPTSRAISTVDDAGDAGKTSADAKIVGLTGTVCLEQQGLLPPIQLRLHLLRVLVGRNACALP